MSKKTIEKEIAKTIIQQPNILEKFRRIFYNRQFVTLRDLLFILIASKYAYSFLLILYSRGPSYFVNKFGLYTKKLLYRIATSTPYIKDKVKNELDKAISQISESAETVPEGQIWYNKLPIEGMEEEKLISLLRDLEKLGDKTWEIGLTSGSVYRAKGEDDENILKEVIHLYGLSNILHPEMFPAINKMEREIVSMVLDMYNAPKGAAGCFSMGGTESILLACRTYKQYGYKVKGISKPEMIVPITAHAAFDKASEYFGIELIHVPVDENYQVDLKAVKRLINSNTIMLVGSCMNYPNGMIDNIEGLSKLAKKYNIGLHVDCCLGGFLVPFMEEAGFNLPLFDFRLEGVTSISCDTHKYGCTIKGSSVVLYRSAELFSHQFSIYPEWTGGIYATHSIQGSRPGILVAACWAALMSRGRNFYVKQAREVVETAMIIKKKSSDLPLIKIMGNPLVSVVAFEARDSGINPLIIADAMQEKGWTLNKLQNPTAFHLACTARTIGKADKFIEDLKDSIEEVKNNSKLFSSSTTQLYGSKTKLEGTGVSDQLISAYLIGLLKV
ncbi:PLP-dependent transferase [Neoconidiobolus thromboides FSU 785]|nr:PLP-dependent transferase [Neoconidiobolus thromboides FSU 785]